MELGVSVELNLSNICAYKRLFSRQRSSFIIFRFFPSSSPV